MSRDYVLGLDGGGTSTKSVALDLEGNELFRFSSGTINVNGASEEKVNHHLKSIFNYYKDKLGKYPLSVVIGAAGLTNKREEIILKKTIEELEYAGKMQIVGDQHVALVGALGKSEGILLISGTGSVCYAFDKHGNDYRVGGYGHLVDDFGSAYSIGRDIIISIIQERDKRSKPTVFTELVKNKLNITEFSDLIEFVYTRDRPKKDIADLASLVIEATELDDSVAMEIQDKAIEDLFKMLEAMTKQLALDSAEISFAGSVLEKNDYIRSGVIKRFDELKTKLSYVEPRYDPASGAARMALTNLN